MVISAALGVAAALSGPVVTPAFADPALCSEAGCSFVSPNQSIECVITVGSKSGAPDGAFCAWSDGDRAQSVRLLPNGVLQPCINPAVAVVDRCTTTPLTGVATLGYGQTANLGPFTCTAEAQGITCTAAPSGRGFAISSLGILPAVAPPPPPPPPAPESPEATPPAPEPPEPAGAPAGQ